MQKRTSLWLIGGGCLFLLFLILVPAVLVLTALSRPEVSLLPRATETVGPPLIQNTAQERPTLQITEALPVIGSETQVASPPEPAGRPESLTELYRQVNPGVVSIHAQVSQGGQAGEAAGSGFIIDNQGYIATNHHVVAGAGTIFVSFFDGAEAQAEVVGSDPDSDLAVLRVQSLPEGAHALPLGDSDQVQVGEWVVAIGNPFNIGSSMSLGIVSAVGRVIPAVARESAEGFSNFSIPKAIQTDAAINPGNSGGPMINMNGEVVGVNAQIQSTTGSNTGVGFAIPVNILKIVAPALIENGSYQWPWLGVSGMSVNPTIAEANQLGDQRGAYILLVVPDSPADQAGLQGVTQDSSGEQGFVVPTGGDVIVEADGEAIESYDELLTLIAFKRPGEVMELVVLRGGERMNLSVTIQARP